MLIFELEICSFHKNGVEFYQEIIGTMFMKLFHNQKPILASEFEIDNLEANISGSVLHYNKWFRGGIINLLHWILRRFINYFARVNCFS